MTADRARQLDFTVARRGRIRKKDIDRAIGALTTSQTILCSDSHVSYKGYAIDKGIEHHPLRSDMKQRVMNGIYHIQHVNSLHSHLKKWLSNQFYGISTKYLQKYLNWFRIKQQLKKSKNFVKDFAELSLNNITARRNYEQTLEQYLEICDLQR